MRQLTLYSWLLSLVLCLPSVVVLRHASPGWYGSALVVGFAGCLAVFWLNAWYGLWCLWYGRQRVQMSKEPGSEAKNGPAQTLRIALLYPTRNDFMESRVASLVQLAADAAGRVQVFILDDATLPTYREQAEAFVAAHPGVTLMRRDNHRGWKAGNLNHCLAQIHGDFDAFVVCDADGVLSGGISGVKVASESDMMDKVAFVQFRQEGNPAQSGFAGVMGSAVGMHFRHLVRARARDGFVMFYGHGALISMEAWRVVGGFPEIVTEDLAFSMLLRTAGWHGVYADELVCYEDYPDNLAKLRKRTDKWIRGTFECLRKFGWKFIRGGGNLPPRPNTPGGTQTPIPSHSNFQQVSERVDNGARSSARGQNAPARVAEKFDVFMHSLTYVMAPLMLIFLLLVGWLLPMEFKEFRHPGGFFITPVPDGKSLVQQAMELRYRMVWSWNFYLLMLLSVSVPLFPPVMALWRSPAKMLRHLSMMIFLHLSGLVAETGSVIAFLTTGRAVFRPTNDTAPAECSSYHPNTWYVHAAEVCLGSVFLALGWRFQNLWLMGPGTALLLVPVACWKGTESWGLRWLLSIPALVTLGLMVLIGVQLALGK